MYRVLSQANERRGGKGKEAHEYHQTSRNDEGVGDAYLLGNESRKQQPNGAGQDGQTVIEGENATEFFGCDFDLQDGVEAGGKDGHGYAADAGGNHKPKKLPGTQYAADNEGEAHKQGHGVDEYHL